MQGEVASFRMESAELAFERELVALIPQVRAFARALAGGNPDIGDDIAQETIAKAWAGRSGFELGTNLKAWVFTIARNQFYSLKRRDWRSVPLEPEEAERTLLQHTYPNGNLELNEVQRALDMLAPEQREAIILIGAGGLHYEEAARILGVAVGTVKSRTSRGRAALAHILAEGRLASGRFDASSAKTILDEVGAKLGQF